MKRYCIEIKNNTGIYETRLHTGDPGQGHTIPNFDPRGELVINGRPVTLDTLTRALRLDDRDLLDCWLDESGQLAVGRYLFENTLGHLPPFIIEKFCNDDNYCREIRIISRDPEIISLPWVLLYHNGFLFLRECSIALAPGKPVGTARLPTRPRMLILAPDPREDTLREEHLAELKTCLRECDPALTSEKHLQVVSTREAYCRALQDFHPHLLYYYGHAEGDLFHVRLWLESDTPGEIDYHPVLGLKSNLEKVRSRERGLPLLAYFNCCQGDSGGLCGAGSQLAGLIPAVVTNRTTAWIPCARRQALTFWESLLARGLAPGPACVEVYSRLGEKEFNAREIKWFTPVLHLGYDKWEFEEDREGEALSPETLLYLDRTQSHEVLGLSQDMLQNYAPRSFAFCWYGEEGQGLELFHEKLLEEFRRKLPATVEFAPVTPRWPPGINNSHEPGRQFTEMMLETFSDIRACESLGDIKEAIRCLTDGASGRTTLVYLRHHVPYAERQMYNPITVRKYLNWLDKVLIPWLPEHQFIVAGLSFEVQDGQKFLQVVQKVKLTTLAFNHTHFRLLPPLSEITLEDIIAFMNIFYQAVSREERLTVAEKIMQDTGGRYEQVREMLIDYLNKRHSGQAPEISPDDPDNIDINY